MHAKASPFTRPCPSRKSPHEEPGLEVIAAILGQLLFNTEVTPSPAIRPQLPRHGLARSAVGPITDYRDSAATRRDLLGVVAAMTHRPTHPTMLEHLEPLNFAAANGSHHDFAGPIGARRRRSGFVHANRIGRALCLCLGLLSAGCSPRLATKADNATPLSSPMLRANYSGDAEVPFVTAPITTMADGSRQANFASESASRRTREMADWVVSSRDNLNMPFAIIDKVNAKVYVFGVDGQLHGAAPALLGMAHGDYVAPGVGNMRMSHISPAGRTTPAGRFVATMGRNSRGKEILWVNYENAISMHPIVAGRPEERRAQRLDTPSPLDNRISYGCINVPAIFFKHLIQRTFLGQAGIVYVLPDKSQAG